MGNGSDNPHATGVPAVFFRRVWQIMDGVLFPRTCVVCGRFFGSDAPGPTGHLAGCLCRDCRAHLRPVASPLCPRCGRVFSGRTGSDHLCADCLLAPGPFRRARAWGLYEGSLLEAVHQFKYRGKTVLARPLGRLLYAAFQRWWQPGRIDAVIPVPLHPKRLRERGFNQALQLVRQWPPPSEADGVWHVAENWLIRRRITRPQTGLGRKERLTNLRRAFALNGAPPLPGKRVLLVDDVYTTGATAGECARVLQAGGAASVDVLTLARAVSN